jgi:hypothetical protein
LQFHRGLQINGLSKEGFELRGSEAVVKR